MKHVAPLALLILALAVVPGRSVRPARAQSSDSTFSRLITAGAALLNRRDYQRAIRKFQAAARFNPAQAEKADAMILETFRRIEAEKTAVDEARQEAVQARRQIEAEKTAADQARDQAVQARRQSDRLARYFFEEGR